MPFRISLRSFLIATTVIGVGGGILYRLLTYDPETFRATIQGVGTIGAVLLLLVVAVRAALTPRGVWSEPCCQGCGAELKASRPTDHITCNGCQAKLSRLDQIKFSPVHLYDNFTLQWIAVAVLLPFLCGAIVLICFPGGRTYAPMSTDQLIATELKGRENPFAWKELEQRHASRRLTSAQVDAALRGVATTLQGQRDALQGALHLPWAGNFVRDPSATALASNEALSDLAAAVYQPTLQVDVVPAERLNSNTQGRVIEISVTSPGTGPFMEVGLKVNWVSTKVAIDGVPIEPIPQKGVHATHVGGEVLRLPEAPTDGPIEVEVVVQCVRGSQKLSGFNEIPRGKPIVPEEVVRSWTLKGVAKQPSEGN